MKLQDYRHAKPVNFGELPVKRISGSAIEVLTSCEKPNLIIADPPYEKIKLCQQFIELARSHCTGALFVFQYPENARHLPEPDQILHWIKQPSTKNTSRRYARFVEVILAYDLDRSPFHNIHWSAKSGVFLDSVITKDHPFKKPESLIEKLVLVNSNKGDLVIDPFAGSFTVESVCTRLDRRCVSIEVS